ncbi:GntR family transcriptional regulator [Gordonia sp. NB41Y]|uniref:GntR family transcriptional regulator n=1 Tax=Gordonia sp. NB41Y TaxID=875808 RepID=UPI0006B21A72|nr:GntR family transcriptional regulator [Gordonia sp. NB41Y]EMP14601.2 GntR family transcriptional regulator [Gordonia sp. NB41Y]WLP89805.1 GntR family transcriptional regulator [Gordonia sp. NB41Y]
MTEARQLQVDLDRSTPVPLYHQLAQGIEAAIIRGDLAPGDRLENELDLAKRLRLSRPTIRQAIQELVDKGVVVRKRGVGTQVVLSPVNRSVELTSLFDDLSSAGMYPTTQLLEYRRSVADEELRSDLGLAAGAEVVTIRRLRSAGGEPLAVMTNHLPADICPPAGELEDGGLYKGLRARGVHIRLARQVIGAKAAEPDEAAMLETEVGSPLLTMQRTAFDDAGKVVEVGRHAYRADRYFFETTVVDR